MAEHDDLISMNEIIKLISAVSSANAASQGKHPYQLVRQGKIVDTLPTGTKTPTNFARYTRSSVDEYLRNRINRRKTDPSPRKASTQPSQQDSHGLGSDQVLLVRLAQLRQEADDAQSRHDSEMHRLVDEKILLQSRLEHLEIDADSAVFRAQREKADFESLYSYVIDKFGPQGPEDMPGA